MSQVLLIEPDKILADVYEQALIHDGHDVVIASEAQEAINAADQLKPDLVIMEIQLMGHNGIEFLYEFRSYPEWSDIPVIVNSLIASEEFRSNKTLYKNLNVKTFLYKPRTSLRQLLEEVSRISIKTPSSKSV
ncbi:MAG TPA: response regulator [Candidatus Saccharimonadales bacterium]|nr:response regulator [Candidatus Saccharimonadales bacterium]